MSCNDNCCSSILKEQDDKILNNFCKWIEKVGVEISAKVRIGKEGSCDRYGMIATSNIEQDEILFTIPKTALLCPETCSIQRVLNNHSEELSSPSNWCQLITCLMYEYLNTNSQWLPYLDFLPKKDSLNHPMFWSENEKNIFLKGTGSIEKINSDIEHITDEFEKIAKPFIQKQQNLGVSGFDIEKMNLDLYKHMAAVVMAYSFSDEAGDGAPKMVPLADMLNHVSDNNARLEFGDSKLAMIATQPIKQGQEVYNTYGPLNNSQLLQNYGFVENSEENMFDAVTVPLNKLKEVVKSLNLDFEDVDTKFEYLKMNDILPIEEFIVTTDGLGVPDDFYWLQGVLRLNKSKFDELRSLSIDEYEESAFEEEIFPDCFDEDEQLISWSDFKKNCDPEVFKVFKKSIETHMSELNSNSQLPSCEVAQNRKSLADRLIRGQMSLVRKVLGQL